jgi:hypothetical protein
MSQLPNLIGLSGYAQSGKDSVATVLVRDYGYERIAFADPIKDLLYLINPTIDRVSLQYIVDNYGWETAKQHIEVRQMLQDLGVGARELFGSNFWIDIALAKVKHEHKVVITDVRFKNEAQMITISGGELWRVERPHTGPANAHISELELDNHPVDRRIYNNAGLKGLENSVKDILRHARITIV